MLYSNTPVTNNYFYRTLGKFDYDLKLLRTAPGTLFSVIKNKRVQYLLAAHLIQDAMAAAINTLFVGINCYGSVTVPSADLETST